MKFISTRLSAPSLNFEEVIFQGLASDGGLYIPEFLPILDDKKLHELKNYSYPDLFLKSLSSLSITKFRHKIIKKLSINLIQHFLIKQSPL